MFEKRKIQLLYFPGTFGNCIQWCVEKFLPGSKITSNIPWDENGRIHQEDWPYHKLFQLCHHVHTPGGVAYDRNKPIVVVTFEENHFLLAERLYYHRVILENKNEFLKYKDHVWLKETFGPNYDKSDAVIKEIYKLFFHQKKNEWWDAMKAHMSDTKHFQFPLYSLLDVNKLEKSLVSLSNTFNLGLKIDRNVLGSIVSHVKSTKQISTLDRADTVLNAIKTNNHMVCKDLDLLEQAWIETKLENQQLLFPYGVQWFHDTQQIIEFIRTYPLYLKRDHNLPWIDKQALTKQQESYTIRELVEATKNIDPTIWKK